MHALRKRVYFYGDAEIEAYFLLNLARLVHPLTQKSFGIAVFLLNKTTRCLPAVGPNIRASFTALIGNLFFFFSN